MPHAVGQLSPRSTTTEPMCPRAHTLQWETHCDEQPVPGNQAASPAPQREKAQMEQQRPGAAKNELKKKKHSCLKINF